MTTKENSDGYEALAELALNIKSSWNHRADLLWQQLDPELWEQTHNPWVVLQTVSRERLSHALADPNFNKAVNDLVQGLRQEAESPGWYQQQYPNSPLKTVAYFSMEYMLSEALPIYSGGLGNVAGDQLKAASDLALPVVAVGLLYQQGYFRQVIDRQGAQEAFYPFNDPGFLPITPVRDSTGEWLRLQIDFPGYTSWVRCWQAQVGRCSLYLLDSNDPANFPPHRGITSELYGGGPELRLQQELILGIGGYRLLTQLGIKPEVCHLNEGHAAFAALERARDYMQARAVSFDEALHTCRAGNLFTTHTAVAAGFDRFQPQLIQKYLQLFAEEKLKISMQELLSLGRNDPNNADEPFNMAYLAIRACGAINGVSRLHGQVSRKLFAPLFEHWPLDEVPVGAITNGVHMPSWDSQAADTLWTTTCGKDRWLSSPDCLQNAIDQATDATLWQMRNSTRKHLIEYARKRYALQLATLGMAPQEIEYAKQIFDPNTLTLGFARRFATYKRPNMLLYDQERLIQILTDANRPVQLIIAGKAHPEDRQGQELIEAWSQFLKRPEVRGRAIFLSDYDMLLTEQLVGGVDVWINTPMRPWEACGTSGMKVLVNGGLNFSELDGWWAEAYSPDVGWALGDGQEHDNQAAWTALEASRLYDILEQEIVPQFYTRDASGIPTEWVAKMRRSLCTLTPQYSAIRTVRDYLETYYIPCATRYLERSKANSQQFLAGKYALAQHWAKIRFGQVEVQKQNGQYRFEAQIYLDDLSVENVSAQIYAEGLAQTMTLEKRLEASPGFYLYSGTVPASRPQNEYTLRLIPNFPGALVPLELSQILWQK